MGKSIQKLMTANPSAIGAGEPIASAAKIMRDENVGLVPIVDGERVVGTVTDRDIAIRVVAEGKDPQSGKVEEIASTEVVTVKPQQDLDEALRLMASHQVRRLPVVDDDGRLVGVLAQADVAREAGGSQTGEMVEQISK